MPQLEKFNFATASCASASKAIRPCPLRSSEYDYLAAVMAVFSFILSVVIGTEDCAPLSLMMLRICRRIC
ncbi:MAG: hypothetical protein ACI9PZ_002025, partial [Parvicella sp.]